MLLSHLVSKRFSREYENIATDALAFILETSEGARLALCDLLRRVDPSLPELHFRSQESDDNARPDLWGMLDSTAYAFIENKFWAGLTDKQPVRYLQLLAARKQPSVLMFVVPAERQETIWGELKRRLAASDIGIGEIRDLAPGLKSGTTALGPSLAVTSWHTVLAALDGALVADPRTLGDLHQLRSLCLAADDDAARSLSSEKMTDQDLPRLLLSMGSIIQDAIERACANGPVNTNGLKPQADWVRTGRYLRFAPERVAWIGVHTLLWRKFGLPVWCVFYAETEAGRASCEAVRQWAEESQMPSGRDDQGRFCVGLHLQSGVEREAAVSSLVSLIEEIGRRIA